MTKHTAYHTPVLADQISLPKLLRRVFTNVSHLLNLGNPVPAESGLPPAIRYDIGEDDCRPAAPQTFKARHAAQQRSLEMMRMRSF